MRGLVVGLGSMGKRRARLMRRFFPDIELCGVDSREERRDEAAGLFGIPCFVSIEEAAAAFRPEVGFVCTSPLSHSAIISQLLTLGLHVFTEINLVADGYETNAALAEAGGRLLFLSSTPLYRREIAYIERAVAGQGGAVAYRYHVGQYLPDWHPWESYSNFFVGDRRTNGCREIFAIELPWIDRAFGRIAEARTTKMRLSTLDIDYPDTFLVSLRHEGGAEGQLAVDVVSRRTVRELEIYGQNIYLSWKGTPDSLSVYDIAAKVDIAVDTYDSVTQDERYAKNIIENAYVDELAAFFNLLDGKQVRRHSLADDARLLAVIDGIEG